MAHILSLRHLPAPQIGCHPHPRQSRDLADFVSSYCPGDRRKRTETDRFHRFTYEELEARDKASLDIFWLKDESLEDLDNLPEPAVLAAEIVEDLEAALAEFSALAASLSGTEADDEA